MPLRIINKVITTSIHYLLIFPLKHGDIIQSSLLFFLSAQSMHCKKAQLLVCHFRHLLCSSVWAFDDCKWDDSHQIMHSCIEMCDRGRFIIAHRARVMSYNTLPKTSYKLCGTDSLRFHDAWSRLYWHAVQMNIIVATFGLKDVKLVQKIGKINTWVRGIVLVVQCLSYLIGTEVAVTDPRAQSAIALDPRSQPPQAMNNFPSGAVVQSPNRGQFQGQPIGVPYQEVGFIRIFTRSEDDTVRDA